MFHGQGGAVADIELAAALGVADMNPGGSTEGAVETRRVTKGIRECGMPPAALATAPTAGGGQRSLAATPRSV